MESEANEFDWDELLTFITDRRVIPIVGKELLLVSINGRDVLLEHYLAERLAEALGVSHDSLPAGDLDLNSVALLHLRNGGDSRKIYSKLKAVATECQIPVPDSLKQLAAITDFNFFVSLTFDSLLAEAINLVRYHGEDTTRCLVFSPARRAEDVPFDPERLNRLEGTWVYHLFGKLASIPDYVVTEEDLLEFIHELQTEKRPGNLFDALRRNNLLFLGCGFEDWLERFALRTMIDERLSIPRNTTEFIVDEHARQDKSLTVFLQQHRAQVFSAGDPQEFVDSLHSRWCEQRPPASAAAAESPGIEEPGWIFLSYASEDRGAAQTMKEALEGAGLQVWFDQQALTPGAAWDRVIRRRIRNCAVFLPFVSPNAQRRREGYFRKEWTWAIDRDEGIDESLRFIQPIILGAMSTPAEHIPDYFWTRQCTDCATGQPSASFVEQLRNLVQGMRKRQVR